MPRTISLNPIRAALAWLLMQPAISSGQLLPTDEYDASEYQPVIEVNAPLTRFDPDTGYRARLHQRAGNDPELELVLTFSGGGTRAAALAYGVLQELGQTRIGNRRLLDEVDRIHAVSGGSVTAAYYALNGDRLFNDFEDDFLRRNIQALVTAQVGSPRYWQRLSALQFNRADVAADFYSRELFADATFADLMRDDRPFVSIHATDLTRGSRFTFTQDTFDLICSDLAQLPVGRAIAASSATPFVFAPLVLKNRAGDCGGGLPTWAREALQNPDHLNRRYREARLVDSYRDSDSRGWVHLLDGGLSDNLGLRGPIEELVRHGRYPTWRASSRLPDDIVFIVVDAGVWPDPHNDSSSDTPGVRSVFRSTTTVQMNLYSFEAIELLRRTFDDWLATLPRRHRPRVHIVRVAFDLEKDPVVREQLGAVLTTFVLPDTSVDRVIGAGRRILAESPQFKAFLQRYRK